MNRYILRILITFGVLFFSQCTENHWEADQLQASWLFKESSGGLLGPVVADPDDPVILTFAEDGSVSKTSPSNGTSQYYYKASFFHKGVLLSYKYNPQQDYQLLHKALIEDNILRLIPFLGENTSCEDCATETYIRLPGD